MSRRKIHPYSLIIREYINMDEHVEQIPIISELTLKLFYYLFLFSQRNKTLKSTRWFKASINVEYYRIIGYSKYWKKRSFANFKYIYMYTRPKIYRLKKRRKKFRAETAPRTEIKGHVSGIQIHGGVYNMVVSSNVRFIRDAHARTPNSALIVNTWKVWFGYGDHVLHACISSQGKTRRNGGEKRGWRERGEGRGEGTSASQISRDICSVLMVVRFSGSKEFRSSWSFTFAFAIRASRVCARIRVSATKVADGRRYTGRGVKNLLEQRDWKVFLTPFDA